MLVQIVPYIIGAAVSPVVLAVIVLLLAQTRQPLRQAAVFFLGGLTAAIPVGSLVFFTVHVRSQSARPSLSTDVIHILIGLLLVFLAVRMWRKPQKSTPKVQKKIHYGRIFLLGLGLVATDFTSLIMFVPASLELQAASPEVRLTGLVLLITALTMAMWLPLLLVIVLGDTGRALLRRANLFMAKHGQQVTATVVGAIGLYMLARGLTIVFWNA